MNTTFKIGRKLLKGALVYRYKTDFIDVWEMCLVCYLLQNFYVVFVTLLNNLH